MLDKNRQDYQQRVEKSRKSPQIDKNQIIANYRKKIDGKLVKILKNRQKSINVNETAKPLDFDEHWTKVESKTIFLFSLANIQ